VHTNEQKSSIQPESASKQTTRQCFDFKSWCFRYGELGHQIAECHKVKSHSSKNLFVKEFNKKKCDLIYDDSDDSKKVL
jgi:hypothetical protein